MGIRASLMDEATFRAVARSFTDEADGRPAREASWYADAFEVALDLQTGICVTMREIGGERSDTGFDVTIHEVDADYPDELFR